jgi:hypothetical protein
VSRTSFLFDIRELHNELRDLGRDMPMIMARSLNRAATAGKTAMVRAAAKDSGIQVKYINREIRVDKANRTRPTVTVEVVGKRLPVIAFDAKGPEPSRGRGRGVSWRGEGGSRKRDAHAFITHVGKGQHRGVFKRLAKSRSRRGQPAHSPGLPIRELMGPSIPTVLEKQLPVFRSAADEALLKNLRHEIDFAKQRAGAGVPDAA